METLEQMFRKLIPDISGLKAIDSDTIVIGRNRIQRMMLSNRPLYSYQIATNSGKTGSLEIIAQIYKDNYQTNGPQRAIRYVRDNMNSLMAQTDGTPNWKEYDRQNKKLSKIINAVNRHETAKKTKI